MQISEQFIEQTLARPALSLRVNSPYTNFIIIEQLYSQHQGILLHLSNHDYCQLTQYIEHTLLFRMVCVNMCVYIYAALRQVSSL